MPVLPLMQTYVEEMLVDIGPSWRNFLQEEFDKPYFIELSTFVHEERHKPGIAVYPPANLVFNWTRFCDVLNVKAVILGQDPYHEQGKAHGLSFSVPYEFPCPRSLLAIYTELETDINGFTRPGHGTLIGWARQGVLLLNTYLTVRGGQPNSHTGWMTFTRAVISKLIVHRSRIVFMLWGTEAQNMEALINGDPNVFQHKSKHLFLRAAHPAARAPNNLVNLVPFLGCHHFSQCNNYLANPIDWNYLP